MKRFLRTLRQSFVDGFHDGLDSVRRKRAAREAKREMQAALKKYGLEDKAKEVLERKKKTWN